jgi:chromosome partitioning protein|tara:strand:+ start:2575 stop:3138 length:564 start_codon:yes stop_codon:yes gene_type:complete
MPSHPDLSNIERELESRQKVYKLRNALAELDDEFDRIYIDTPPAYNFYTNAALIAADSLLIPFDCDRFSLEALNNIVAVVNEIKEDHNAGLSIEGVIVNQYHGRTNFHRDVLKKLNIGDVPVLEPFLPASVKMKESRDLAWPLIYYAPKHKLTVQLTELFSKLEPDLEKTRKSHPEIKAAAEAKHAA